MPTLNGSAYRIVWDDFHLRAFGATVDRPQMACPPKLAQRAKGEEPTQTRLPGGIGSGFHPFPFRTRKLSLIPPMVLYGKLYGRVGRCRHYHQRPETLCLGPFSFLGKRPIDAAVSHCRPSAGKPPGEPRSGERLREVTGWETVWESRSLPALIDKKPDVSSRVGLFAF